MWAMIVNILNFGFTIAAVLVANYIMLLGIRDIIYFIVPGLGGRKPFNLAPGKTGTVELAKRVLFWVAFVAVCLVYMYLVFPFLLFVIAGRILYSGGRSLRVRPATMSMIVSILLLGITYIQIRSQPVVMKFGDQFSADMWIYNSGNSLLELMMRTAMRYGIPTDGAMYLASLIPGVQKNMYGYLVLAIYVFSCVLVGKLGIIFLKGPAYKMEPYYMIPPVRVFPVVLIGLLIARKYNADISLPLFVAGGIYYAWGINLMVYAMRGGKWAVNMLLFVALATHPATAMFFVVAGVADNLLDLRRMGALMGLKPRFE